jgi:hypothetical protein
MMGQLMEFSLIMANKIPKYTNGSIVFFDDSILKLDK